MPLYRSGAAVVWRKQKHTISHVMLRRDELWIYLVKRAEPVRPESLQIKPTLMTTARQPERFALQAPVKKHPILPLPAPTAQVVKLPSLD